MWVFLSDAFLSVVHKDCAPDELLVRARVAGDIKRVFPGAVVTESDVNDYRYRAVVKRTAVAAALEAQVMAMRYPNFKDTVRNQGRHHAYSRVWSAMLGLQPARPRPAQARLFADYDVVRERPAPRRGRK